MNAALGDLVAYEDQANPRTIYRVVGSDDGADEYRLHSVETGKIIWSDLRQSGWTHIDEEEPAEDNFWERVPPESPEYWG